jgi:hypothetical protein
MKIVLLSKQAGATPQDREGEEFIYEILTNIGRYESTYST